MHTHRIGLVQQSSSSPVTRARAMRWGWLGTAVLPAFALAGCLAAPSPGDEPMAEVSGVECPPDEPDCDRLDEPCAFDDEEGSATGPGSSPMGLTEDKTAAGKYRVWPKGRVPYKIDSTVGVTTKGLLLQAMNEWEQKTSGVVRFENATATDTIFLAVSAGNTITSHVGYKEGIISKVKLRNPEYVTVIRHELGHVLGLHHEQRRSDRADYIQVKTANIVDDPHCKYQFSVCTDCELIKSYQVGSIMQYRTSDLSKCRIGPVLLHKDGSAIKHTWVITPGDAAVIQQIYGAPAAAGTGGAGNTGGTGGTSASTGGTGGEAGSASGSGGAAGDDSISEPDEETGGSGGAAGTTAAGGSTAGAAGSAGSTPTGAAGNTTGDSGGCSASGAPRRGEWALFGLALASLGLVRRRRAARRVGPK